MDPLTLGIAAVGLGMQLFGGAKQSAIAKESAQVSQDMAMQEQAINRAKVRQMEMEGRRMQMENIRNTQRARAMAVQAGVNQGAQFGTGLLGGIAGVQNKGAWNMQGVQFGLDFGREVAGYNDKISADKMQLAQLGSQSAQASGWSSLGGALLKAGPTIGAMSQGFGSSQSMANPYGSMPKAGSNDSWYT